MEPDVDSKPAHQDEPYVAPDVQRLGTAEALTAGNFFSLVGDLASNTIPG